MIITKLEFIQRTSLDQQTLEMWIQEQWLVPDIREATLEFSEADLARAELIVDLRDNLGVNDEGIGVILHLVDQIHGLRGVLGGFLLERRAARQSEAEQQSELTRDEQ